MLSIPHNERRFIDMKTKAICAFLSLCLVLALAPLQALGAENKRHNWFFKSAGNNTPELLGGETFWQDYGAVALGNPEEKVLYLTFDAGYENGNVTKLLCTVGTGYALIGLLREPFGMQVHSDFPLDQH
jgi:hypothetical protein